jgi:uncharacterized protein (TIGR03083 family)
MTLPRAEVEAGLIDELARFEAQVRALDAAQGRAPTRCEGWTASDVAAHVIGTLADIAGGRLEGLGTAEVTARQVAERRERTPAELADELAEIRPTLKELSASFSDEAWSGPAPAGITGTLGAGVEALWYDAYLHGEDIRSALGQPPEQGPGLAAAVSHVVDVLASQGWGPSRLDLGPMGTHVVGAGEPSRELAADPYEFVLVGTGRADPATLGLDETVNIYRES